MLRALLHSADDFFTHDGAWSILALDAIFLIPLMFAVFFYPMAFLAGAGAMLVLTIAALVVMRAVRARRHT